MTPFSHFAPADHRLQQRAGRRFAWHWQPLKVAGRTIRLAVPADPVRLLSDVCCHQAGDHTGVSDPFWAQVWKSTEGIDRYLGRRSLDRTGVLELGCGTGAAGMAALLRGAAVTFTDGASAPLLLVRISLAALELRENSAKSTGVELPAASVGPRMNGPRMNGPRMNGPRMIGPRISKPTLNPGHRWRVRRLRFGLDVLASRFPLILGSDISYLKEVWPELLQTLELHLAEGGEVLLSDPYRSISTEFSVWALDRGWRAEEHHQPLEDTAIRILRLTRR